MDGHAETLRLRVFLLDVHNEYGRCFGDRALVLNPRNLKLPFWLFNFEEIVDVLFAGRPGVPEELDILAEVKDVRTPLRKSFVVDVSGGRLTLEFDPVKGEAIVSSISIRRQK